MDRYALLITIKQGWGLRKKEIILGAQAAKKCGSNFNNCMAKTGTCDNSIFRTYY